VFDFHYFLKARLFRISYWLLRVCGDFLKLHQRLSKGRRYKKI
jgi:hypothetical protein